MITAAHLQFGPDFLRALWLGEATEADSAERIRETWSAPSVLESWEDEVPHFGTALGSIGDRPLAAFSIAPLDLLLTIPRNLRSSIIDNLGGKSKLTIDALVDEPLAKHHPHPLHFTASLLVFLKPLLLPFQPSSSFSRSSSHPLALQSSGMNSYMLIQLCLWK